MSRQLSTDAALTNPTDDVQQPAAPNLPQVQPTGSSNPTGNTITTPPLPEGQEEHLDLGTGEEYEENFDHDDLVGEQPSSDAPITRGEFMQLQQQITQLMKMMKAPIGSMPNSVPIQPPQKRAADPPMGNLREHLGKRARVHREDSVEILANNPVGNRSLTYDSRLDEIQKEFSEMKEAYRMNSKKRKPGESPFTQDVVASLLPKGFKIPHMDKYDGSTDPEDHVRGFTTLMELHGAPDPIFCKAFPATLERAARIWFDGLEPRSISTFEQLYELFLQRFATSKRQKKNAVNLLGIKQGRDESLRSFVARFNKEVLEVEEFNDVVTVAAMTKGLQQNTRLFRDLAMEQPRTYHALLSMAEKYIAADEIITESAEEEKDKKGRAEERDIKSRLGPRVDGKDKKERSDDRDIE